MVTTMRRPSSAKKPRIALITLGTAVILVSCVFQVVSEHDKEAAEQRWQAQLIASDLFGRNPQTVIAFLDHHHLYHSAYEKLLIMLSSNAKVIRYFDPALEVPGYSEKVTS